MAVSLSAATGSTALHGSWSSSFTGTAEDRATLLARSSAPVVPARVARPRRSSPRMGNVNEGKGIFAPLVVVTRNIIGKKQFNQLRGKAIALHSQALNPSHLPRQSCRKQWLYWKHSGNVRSRKRITSQYCVTTYSWSKSSMEHRRAPGKFGT